VADNGKISQNQEVGEIAAAVSLFLFPGRVNDIHEAWWLF
jgi:hypothetical protein